MIINLIATPRNLSTSLMYSFAQRSDTAVIDEPLFGVFLQHSDAYRPSRVETTRIWPKGLPQALQWIEDEHTRSPHVFLKNMASHHHGISWEYLLGCVNVFLIRHPSLSIPSFRKQVEHPTIDDIGLHQQHALYSYLREQGRKPLVISSVDLLQDPQSYLSRLCRHIGLPWDEAMLRWPAGPRPEDGPWAKYWYHSVHASTGWGAPRSTATDISPDWQDLYDACMVPYTHLSNFLL